MSNGDTAPNRRRASLEARSGRRPPMFERPNQARQSAEQGIVFPVRIETAVRAQPRVEPDLGIVRVHRFRYGEPQVAQSRSCNLDEERFDAFTASGGGGAAPPDEVGTGEIVDIAQSGDTSARRLTRQTPGPFRRRRVRPPPDI